MTAATPRKAVQPTTSLTVAVVVVAMVLLGSTQGSPASKNGSVSPENSRETSAPAGITFPVGSYPFGVAYDPVNGLLYVSNFGSSNISVVDPTSNRVVAWVPVYYGVGPLAVDTSTGTVYASDSVATVWGINSSTNQVQWNIPLTDAGCPYGCAPDPHAYDPANGDIYVTELVTNYVAAIHLNRVVAAIPAGDGPNGGVYDSINGNIYIASEGSSFFSNLTVINGTSNRVVGEVYPVEGGPGLAFDSSNGEVYLCSNAGQPGQSNLITAVNGSTNQVVASIPTVAACEAAVYDPTNDYVYVTDRFSPAGPDLTNVTVVDPNTHRIVLTLPVQQGPTGIAFDPANHNIYVADSDTNNVSVLPQVYRLNVHETGLPPGTNWSAMVGGTTFFSTTPTISFPETNGTLNFSIGRAANLSANPGSGSVTVDGGPQWLNVTFSKGGGGSGLLGLPGTTGYYVLAGIGAIAAILIAAVVFLTRRRKRGSGPDHPPQVSPPTDNRPP